jgi:hypothetical protein
MTREDLFGRRFLSYFRMSSKPQEKGDSIRRQDEARDRIIEFFRLIPDGALMDKLSASKGHHRTKGELGKLLKGIDEGTIDVRGVVLGIEATDRLVREGQFDAMDVIKTLVRTGGMILVTGDMTIWDEAAINSPLVHKLVAEIGAAQAYATRLGELAAGAHVGRRERLEAFANDPEIGVKPFLNARPPAWIVRPQALRKDQIPPGTVIYSLHPTNAPVLKEIFQLSASGCSCVQIAADLNKRGIAPFAYGERSRPMWTSTAIAFLLRNEAAIGFVQPHRVENGKRVPVGQKVRLYPPAIDDALWMTVRDQLTNRQKKLRGRRGPHVANMFTGHVFCKTCGGAMRISTGGTRQIGRWLICARYLESRACQDTTRYDMEYYEVQLLFDLADAAAPKLNRNADDRALSEELAGVRIQIQTLEETIETLVPRIGRSAALADQVERLATKLDTERNRAITLEMKIGLVSQPIARRRETWAFMRGLIQPACAGDVDLRQRLRSLLAGLDYQITGAILHRGLILTVNGVEHDVYSEGAEPDGLSPEDCGLADQATEAGFESPFDFDVDMMAELRDR